jgi:hypothetical protein
MAPRAGIDGTYGPDAMHAIGAMVPRAEIDCAYGAGAIGAIGAMAPRAEIDCAYGRNPPNGQQAPVARRDEKW